MNINPKKIFNNPIIEEQSRISEAAFVFDSYLGHKMPLGQDFIGECDFLSLIEVGQKIRKLVK